MEILVKDEANASRPGGATQDATQVDASQDATPADTPAEPPVIDGHASPNGPPKTKRGRPANITPHEIYGMKQTRHEPP